MRNSLWILVGLCGGVQMLFGQAGQVDQQGLPIPMAQPVNQGSMGSDTPRGRGGFMTRLRAVLEDGGPPGRIPVVHDSCGIAPMGADGVALVSGSNENPCRVSISLDGFQTVRMDVQGTGHVVQVVLRRVGAEGDGLPSGSVNVAMLKIPVAAHKAYAAGEAAMGLQQWATAANLFGDAVRIDPAHALAWDELGAAFEALGKTQDAKTAYEKALRADPAFGRPCVHLAGIALEERRPADAADFTARSIRASGAPSPRAWFYDAVANFALDRQEKAESSARRTIATDDAHLFPRAEFILGTILAKKGDSEGATAHLRNFLKAESQGAFADTARQRLSEMEAARK